MLQPGQEVDRFRVEAVLGKGGMAVVYKVQHKVLGSSYALKVLTAPTESQRARLVREGRVQSQLRHENIVSVHDVLEVEGAPALLMDFVDGPSLRDWIKANDPEPADAEALFRQVLAGVERAHEAGVVHRDLKPGNVLLELRRQGPLAHVADFGLVKASDDVFETRTGASMGTPAYMAPEQVRNAKEVDQRADIWALGCILYALVVGKPPFRGRDQLALFNNIANGAYEPAGERVPGLPPRIDAAIRACLTPDPDRRAPTCAAVRAVLDGRVAAEVEAPPEPEPAEPQGPAEQTFAFDADPAPDTPDSGGDEGDTPMVLQESPPPPDAPAPAPAPPEETWPEAATPLLTAPSGAWDSQPSVGPGTQSWIGEGAAERETGDTLAPASLDEPAQDTLAPESVDAPAHDTLAPESVDAPAHDTLAPLSEDREPPAPMKPSRPRAGAGRGGAIAVVAAIAMGVGGVAWWTNQGSGTGDPAVPGAPADVGPAPTITPRPEPTEPAPEPPPAAAATIGTEPAAREPEARAVPPLGAKEPEATAPAAATVTEMPAPAPAPAPAQATADPEAPPAPEPEPATVRVSGDATLVKLRDAAGRDWPPGAVPAGRYTVRARFGHEAAGEFSEAGTVVLDAARVVTLHCDRRFGSCGVR